MLKNFFRNFSIIFIIFTSFTDILAKDIELGRVITYDNFSEYKVSASALNKSTFYRRKKPQIFFLLCLA